VVRWPLLEEMGSGKKRRQWQQIIGGANCFPKPKNGFLKLVEFGGGRGYQ